VPACGWTDDLQLGYIYIYIYPGVLILYFIFIFIYYVIFHIFYILGFFVIACHCIIAYFKEIYLIINLLINR
jgi:hypothetical protein